MVRHPCHVDYWVEFEPVGTPEEREKALKEAYRVIAEFFSRGELMKKDREALNTGTINSDIEK